MQQTKILATIGPASMNKTIFKKMVANGLSGVRINAAHGTFAQYKKIVSLVRKNSDIPIIMDVKGPELRVVLNNDVPIKRGEVIIFNKNSKSKESISFNQDIYGQVKKDDKILFDDGKLSGKVIKSTPSKIHISFSSSGIIYPNKSVNIPSRHLDLPALSKKDKEALAFAMKEDLDFIALSFTRCKEDVINLKKIIKKSNLSIIAKIENQEGVNNIDEILQHVDGVMVARGDLGVEIQAQKIPLTQKKIIKKANNLAKIVIVATQVLESMVEKPTPSRAETSDIATAILDGADVIMLSEETAIGKYPTKCVSTIKSVAKEIESYVKNKVERGQLKDSISDAITRSAHEMVQDTKIDSIIAVTQSGYTARLLTRFRINQPIIAVTSDICVYRKLHLTFGVTPYLSEEIPDFEHIIHCSAFLIGKKLVKLNDKILIVGGIHLEKSQASNILFITKAKDLLECKIQHHNH